MTRHHEIIVIGAGHAGVEAAWAAARMGRDVGDLHAVARHHRAHAVQSGDRRHREGAPRPRDRRAWRADGACDRRDRHPVQAAESEPGAGRLVARARRPTSGVYGAWVRARSRARAEHLVACRQGRTDSDDRTAGSPGFAMEDGDDPPLRCAGRHHRDVSQRADSRRARAAAGGSRGRTAVARPGGVAEVARIRMGPPEDGHAAPPASPQHRLFAFRSGARRRATRCHSPF